MLDYTVSMLSTISDMNYSSASILPRRLRLFFSFALVALIPFFAKTGVMAEGNLEKSFTNPPDSAKPQTWWHWMNGNISKEGITADLEAMKQIGLGGATIVNVDCKSASVRRA